LLFFSFIGQAAADSVNAHQPLQALKYWLPHKPFALLQKTRISAV
jgi:hypothetical protein